MTTRSIFRMSALILAPLLALCAIAAATPTPTPTGDDNPVSVRAVPQHPVVEQGGKLVIAVEMDHQSGYHTWPAKEVSLGKDIDEFAIRTEITFPIDDKAQEAAQKAARDAKPPKPDAEVDAIRVYLTPAWVAKFDGVQFPETHKGKVPDPSGGSKPLTVPLYSGKAVSFIRIDIKPDAAPGDQTFNVRIAYQSCNEQVCTMPQEITVPVKVKVVKKGEADAGLAANNEPALFAGFDAKKWGGGAAATPDTKPTPAPKPEEPKPAQKHGDASPGTATPARTQAAAASAAAPIGGATLFGFDLGGNIFIIALASILGGFILNLTPCVLPVIPIKVMSLTQHATSRAHALVLGLWMAAGVVAFWTVIGLPMAIISRQLDPSQYIFGIWWVCLAIGLVVALMGLGIMGLFSLNLPQSVYMVETKADSPMGSFLFGVLAAVLGLPCFGFMAGGLLAAAATMPASAIMTIFVGLGVGMAAPYLVLSVWPQLLKFIPRTGPASELVKQVMGILLLAAAAFFVTAGIQVLLAVYPYLVGSMVWWSVGFFIAIASLWLIVRTWQITKSAGRRLAFSVLAFCMTAGIWLFAQDRLNSDRGSFLERQQAMAEAARHGVAGTPGEAPAGVWLEYTPELFASVRASGRPVFLDFTASWCITCKALKAALLDREPLKSEFKSRGVVLMEVDCSARGGPGSKFLGELGRTGVPTWVVYGPGSDKPRFVPVDKPTSGTVLAELAAAGITPTDSKSASAAGPATKPLLQYTPEAFAQAVADGKVEVISFYAYWDITASPTKARLAALQNDAAMQGDDVVAFSADMTRKSAPGWERWKGLDQPGVPSVAVFGPGVSRPIVLSLHMHDSKELKEAIEKARGTATTLRTTSAGVPPAH